MGCMVTRPGLARHAYDSPAQPAWVTVHAMSAQAPSRTGTGQVFYPLSAPIATFAADGAPYYNSGYLPGYPSRPGAGRRFPLGLGPLALQLDLSDPNSWDRPVIWPGAI